MNSDPASQEFLLKSIFQGKSANTTQTLYLPDGRIYNVWKLSVSCNGWHLAKIKADKYQNSKIKRGA
jgi:hypothetical protein